MNLDQYLTVQSKNQIEVINDYTKRSYGVISKNGEVIEEYNKDSDDDFDLNKLIIEDKNYDKRYEVGFNELYRLERGESIVKGCLFLGRMGTSLIFLRFKCL